MYCLYMYSLYRYNLHYTDLYSILYACTSIFIWTMEYTRIPVHVGLLMLRTYIYSKLTYEYILYRYAVAHNLQRVLYILYALVMGTLLVSSRPIRSVDD